MRKQFTWSAFSHQFLQSICYSDKTPKYLRPKFETDNKDSLTPFLDDICSYPNVSFVRRYREEIAANFFAGSTHLVSLMRSLEKRHYRNARTGSMDDMLSQLRSMNMTSTVTTLIVAELISEGLRSVIDDDDVSIFTSPKTIDLKSCIPDEIPMFDYQEKAIAALNEHFILNDKRSGILCMPTGSGKTRTAANFLMRSMVANGWQIIWLAHRSMLIDQAASTMYLAAGALLPTAARGKDAFKMVCVSGNHASIKATEPDDDMMICSVQSLVRNLPYLHAVIGQKVMLVIDEAHHALAPSYRTIIQEVTKLAGEVKLLGLTATPKRINDSESARLSRIFDDTVIYSVAMSELIAKGFLSTPHYEQIDTNIDFNTTVTLDERKYIQKWGELAPETVERMACMAERNRLIVDTYLAGRERYGKTLIFALNSEHCISLCEELQKEGVRCDYIYCAHKGNDEKIARFKRGELDVLVNIQVLTEGSDVPDIETVFLTRPTASDVLLMQMIGRGMRGPNSHGTPDVNIVDFHDNWGCFATWLNPKFIVSDMIDAPDEEVAPQSSSRPEQTPWQMLRDILDGITTSCAIGNIATRNSELPFGWYDVLDEDGNDRKVLVFNSQLDGYVEIIKNKKEILSHPEYTGQYALHTWFGGFGLQPTADDLQMVINMIRLSDEPLRLHELKKRDAIDASILAERFKTEDRPFSELDGFIRTAYKGHSELIDSVYGGYEIYSQRIREFLIYPNGEKPLGAKIEELPEEELTLDRTPAYDLDELAREVAHERFDDGYGALPPIMWTPKPQSRYFGEYNYSDSGDYIRINSLINSKDVPRETVKYVIYHELLHRDNRFHNTTFRSLEHLYPDWTEHERFLDFTFPKFDLSFAL